MTSYTKFLDKETFNNNSTNLKVTKVKQTDKGYTIHLFTNYICLYYKYVTVNKNGSAKILTKVNRNYQAPYQFTIYEDKDGKEITLKEYKKIN
jgi:hypothetical protein